jgi:hypothetical protein
MPVNERRKDIKLPLKIIFTEEGASALMNQKVKINRLKMGDQSDEYGISLETVNPAFLQRMVMADYISKIEVAGVEPVASRAEIIDLSKLIIYNILYRNYSVVSLEQILGTDPVKKWNHANPSQVIDGKTQFQEGAVQKYIQEHSEELADLRKEILEPIYDAIAKDESMMDDEKRTRTNILQNLLVHANSLVWFVMLKFYKTREYLYLIRDVRLCLREYLSKSTIAEYATLMLMELASNIENLNILKEAKLFYKTERVHIQKVLQDPTLRLPVIEEMRKKNNLLTFSWKLGGTSMAIGTRRRFQVILYDQDINYKETRETLEATKIADVKRYNLSEYYKKLHNSGNELELGMFYLSFLDEACETMGIKFESMVNQTQYTGQTITTLTFTL